MLSSRQLAAMRATVLAAMPGTAVLYERTATRTALGGETVAWSAYGTCAYHSALPSTTSEVNEVTIAARQTNRQIWIVTLPHDTAISTACRVVDGARTFEVVAAPLADSYALQVRVFAVELGNV